MSSQPDISVPPSSLEAERACLGSMLRDNELIPEVMPHVEAEEFYGVAHQLIFRAITDIFTSGSPVDMVTVAETMNERKVGPVRQLDEIGGAAYLAELWDAAPVVGNAVAYAQKIRQVSTVRRLLRVGVEIQRLTSERGMPAEEMLNRAARLLDDVQDRQYTNGLMHISEAVKLSLERIDRRKGMAAGGETEECIETPWRALNDIIVGFNRSELTIVAARPSVGKTLVAINILNHASDKGHRVFFASLEQPSEDVADRFLSLGSGVNSMRFRDGTFNDVETEAVLFAADKLRDYKLWLDDQPSQSLRRIIAQANKVKRRHGLDLVAVDYLGLIDPDDRDVNRNEQISVMTRTLKNLARALKVPVVLLCQLNRNSDMNNRRPRLSDLRDSGSIEQDADCVLLLHKESTNPAATVEPIEVIVGKQRNGPTLPANLLHCKQSYKIVDP